MVVGAMRCSVVVLLVGAALLGGAHAVPRRLEDMGRAGLKEQVKAKMAAEGELEIKDELKNKFWGR